MSKKLGDCSYEDIETLKFGATLYQEDPKINYKTEINIVDINKKENQEVYETVEDEALKDVLELEKFEQEAIQIAKKIIEIKKNFKTFDVKKQVFEPVKYKDIVILLRSIKSKGVVLEKILKKFGIPVFSDASTNLFLSDEVELVMSFLKIVDNPLQDVEMTSVMYSIIGKFTLDELCYIRQYKENKTSYMYDSIVNIKNDFEHELVVMGSFEETLLKKIKEFLCLLKRFQDDAHVYSISEILIRLYKDTSIYYQFALESVYESKKANLNLLIDIARDFEKNTDRSLSAYISYIENIKYSTKGNAEAKILGENEDVVRIMTIHKSKGLEFPVVILADTNANYREVDLTKEVIMHQSLGIGINVVNSNYAVSYPSVLKQAIKNMTTNEIRSEELRMLYVALTRAKEKLIIFATLDDYEKYDQKQFVLYQGNKIDPCIVQKNKSYFQNINMALKKENKEQYFDVNLLKVNITDDFSKITDEENKQSFRFKNVMEKIKKGTIEESEKEKIVKRLKENLDYRYPYQKDVDKLTRVSVSALKEEYIRTLEQEENNVEQIENLFHFENETIKDHQEEELMLDDTIKKEEKNENILLPNCLQEECKPYTPVRKGILVHFLLENIDFQKIQTKDQLKEYIQKLVEEGNISKEDAGYLSVSKIMNFLNSKIGKELKNASEIFREEKFILRKNEVHADLIQGVIDLYYINPKGNIVLVDFKTDRIQEESDFIKKYQIQLAIYQEALEKLTGLLVENVYIYSFYLNKEILLNLESGNYETRK